MSKEKRQRDFVYKAYYEGGSDALRKFVRENMQYPEEAKKRGVEGSVKLSFDVDYKGKVHHVKVISGVGYGCDEEAIRIAELLEYKVPKTYKLKVGFKKKLTIHFRLKNEKVKKPAVKTSSFVYNITSPSTEKKVTYNYQIEINNEN